MPVEAGNIDEEELARENGKVTKDLGEGKGADESTAIETSVNDSSQIYSNLRKRNPNSQKNSIYDPEAYAKTFDGVVIELRKSGVGQYEFRNLFTNRKKPQAKILEKF